MNNIKDSILTDEELDKVVGGFVCYYEKAYDEEIGDYYNCTTPDGTVKIPADDWADWVYKLTEQGHTIEARG